MRFANSRPSPSLILARLAGNSCPSDSKATLLATTMSFRFILLQSPQSISIRSAHNKTKMDGRVDRDIGRFLIDAGEEAKVAAVARWR